LILRFLCRAKKEGEGHGGLSSRGHREPAKKIEFTPVRWWLGALRSVSSALLNRTSLQGRETLLSSANQPDGFDRSLRLTATMRPYPSSLCEPGSAVARRFCRKHGGA
jgi:hypothetical protein